ncbi:unnamed protein product, partial [Ectocarpus sp. 12 AP-2014]
LQGTTRLWEQFQKAWWGGNMSVPTLGTKALFLPNRKGTLKRDNNRRAKAHRMALQSVRGDVDTREPASMKFSRGQLV